jgi:hypothetical protein
MVDVWARIIARNTVARVVGTRRGWDEYQPYGVRDYKDNQTGVKLKFMEVI